MAESQSRRPALAELDDDDLAFITRFVLASGSLKDTADAYRVSYPTIRAKLDSVIQRLQAAISGRPRDAMADLVADLVAAGELMPPAAKRILRVHRSITETSREDASHG